MPRDSLVGSSRRCRGRGSSSFALFPKPHRIGRPRCLENPRPKGGIYTNGERSALHFTLNRNRTERTDRTKIGLIFSKQPPKERIFNVGLNNTSLTIPPGDPHHRVDTYVTLPNELTLVDITPHMHFRGSGFALEATYPDGQVESLVDVPHYEFNWQMTYSLAQPKVLPKGTKLHMTAYYDNSPNNKYNPDPTKQIYWGEQSWEEMITGFMDFAIPVTVDPSKVLPAPARPAVSADNKRP